MLPFRFQLSCEKGVKYRYMFIEFFAFDYYLLSLFFWLGVTCPLVAFDKMVKQPQLQLSLDANHTRTAKLPYRQLIKIIV